jgi:hypothetical protein
MIASEPNCREELSAYHGRRVSVLLSLDSGLCAPHGRAVYEEDPLLGNVLTVHLDEEEFGATPVQLMIRESEWSGLVVADLRQNCDYCFLLTAERQTTPLL